MSATSRIGTGALSVAASSGPPIAIAADALNQLTAKPDTAARLSPGDQPDGPAKPERKRRPYKAP